MEVNATYTATSPLRLVRIAGMLERTGATPGATTASARLLKAVERTNAVVRRRTDVPQLTVR